jgi:hypothetical protein
MAAVTATSADKVLARDAAHHDRPPLISTRPPIAAWYSPGPRAAPRLRSGLAPDGVRRPATQIVLRVDSDLRAGEALRGVQVATRRVGAAADGVLRVIDLTNGANPLPGTLSLVPADVDDPRRLEVTVGGAARGRRRLRDPRGGELSARANPRARRLPRVAVP